jgi:hypothetical protein
VAFLVLLNLCLDYFLIASSVEECFLLVYLMNDTLLILKALILFCQNAAFFKFIERFFLAEFIELKNWAWWFIDMLLVLWGFVNFFHTGNLCILHILLDFIFFSF